MQADYWPGQNAQRRAESANGSSFYRPTRVETVETKRRIMKTVMNTVYRTAKLHRVFQKQGDSTFTGRYFVRTMTEKSTVRY